MDNDKKRGEAAVLVVVVFLLGALLGGVGNHVWGERVWGKQTISSPQLRADRRQFDESVAAYAGPAEAVRCYGGRYSSAMARPLHYDRTAARRDSPAE